MYIICVSELAAILNMAKQEASGDVESSQFGFTTGENICNNIKIIQIRPVDLMLWKTLTFYGGYL